MSKAYSQTGVGHDRRDGEHVRGCTSWGGEDPPVTAQAGVEVGAGRSKSLTYGCCVHIREANVHFRFNFKATQQLKRKVCVI